MRALVPVIVNTDKEATDLIKKIAMDIGKEVVHHIETMYPNAYAAAPSTFKISVRNCVHNQIMASLDVTDEREILLRLEKRAEFRKKMKASFKKNRAKQ